MQLDFAARILASRYVSIVSRALGAHLYARNHLETNIPSNKLTMYVDRNPRALIILSL